MNHPEIHRAEKDAARRFVAKLEDMVGKVIQKVIHVENDCDCGRSIFLLFMDGSYTRIVIESDYDNNYLSFACAKYDADLVRIGSLTEDELKAIDAREEGFNERAAQLK